MSNFAERMKKINNEVTYRNSNPNIKDWKEKQKEVILFEKDDILQHFEWVASFGGLNNDFWNPHKFEFWSEEYDNIPDAKKLTKELVEEIFKPYGIKVVDLDFTGPGLGMICATLKIE